MTNLISPELLRTLGWTLLHFIWQGAALAALLAVAMAACRSAAARYALAVGALALMMASPVITFLWLHRETVPAVRFGAQRSLPWVGTPSSQRFPAPRPLNLKGYSRPQWSGSLSCGFSAY
jgi:hypothetical protein